MTFHSRPSAGDSLAGLLRPGGLIVLALVLLLPPATYRGLALALQSAEQGAQSQSGGQAMVMAPVSRTLLPRGFQGRSWDKTTFTPSEREAEFGTSAASLGVFTLAIAAQCDQLGLSAWLVDTPPLPHRFPRGVLASLESWRA